MTISHEDWIRSQIAQEDYWFLQIDLGNGIVTPGWSRPKEDKLPVFGLPDDMSGMRVLDIGCAEGFFSFEAERRGAREVIAIDPFPASIRRFNICRNALNSNVIGIVGSVYDLDPRSFGTFDLVMFFGVLYHLRHPLLALEKIEAVTGRTMLMQTRSFQSSSLKDEPLARFYRDGVQSGPGDAPIHDPSVFWEPNASCIREMLLHVGFVNVERLIRKSQTENPRLNVKSRLANRVHPPPAIRVTNAIFRAQAAHPSVGVRPDLDLDGELSGSPKL